MWSTLQIGTLKTAPAEVLTVSPFTGAEPVFWTMIPSTPVHSAVLIIAPKFRASLSWSRIKNKGVLPLSTTLSTKVSKLTKEIGAMVATAPWWLLAVKRLSFSTGTYEKLMLFFFRVLSNSCINSPCASV